MWHLTPKRQEAKVQGGANSKNTSTLSNYFLFETSYWTSPIKVSSDNAGIERVTSKLSFILLRVVESKELKVSRSSVILY